LKKELCCEFKGSRIIKDSESSTRWALSKCISAQEDITAGSSEKRHSAKWAFESLCRQAQGREENSLNSVIRRKNPLRDLHRVVEHPERLRNQVA
jgi:hypothetical protein